MKVAMKNAGFAIAFAALFFSGYADVALAQTEMYCDAMCWPKGKFGTLNRQVLTCTRIYETDAEGKQWHDLYDQGDLANGKLLNITSTDDVPSVSNCPATSIGPNTSVRYVKVTGFAYRAKICGASVAPPQKGYQITITACGVTNDGYNANFFPSP